MMREATKEEIAFRNAVMRRLEEINKDPALGLTALQLVIAAQVALQVLTEMHDAVEAKRLLDDWAVKSAPSTPVAGK